MMQCPRCQTTLPQPPDRFCPNCGADLAALGVPGTPGGPPAVDAGPPPPPPPGAYGGEGYGAGGGAYGGGGSGGPGRPGGSIPWEQRDQLGLFSALIENTKQVLTESTDFFRRMPIVGGLGSPLLYAVIIGYVGIVASSIYSAIFNTMVGSALQSGNSGFDRIAPFLQGGGGLVINLILGPVFVVLGLFLGSGIVHLSCLLLAGGGKGFEATFRVAAYAQAAAIINVIPVCGGLIAAVYGIVLWIIGMSEAHGISRGKAAAVVLAPMVIVCCCCIGFLLVVFGGLAGALGNMK